MARYHHCINCGNSEKKQRYFSVQVAKKYFVRIPGLRTIVVVSL